RGPWWAARAAFSYAVRPCPAALREELLDVARRDRHGVELSSAKDLECHLLARPWVPQEPVERAPIGHVLAVDREHDVARLESRDLPGRAGQEARDHHVVFDGVAEDAEPGARAGRLRAP